MNHLYFLFFFLFSLFYTVSSTWFFQSPQELIRQEVRNLLKTDFNIINNVASNNYGEKITDEKSKYLIIVQETIDKMFQKRLNPLLLQIDSLIDQNQCSIPNELNDIFYNINYTVAILIEDLSKKAVKLMNLNEFEIKNTLNELFMDQWNKIEITTMVHLNRIMNKIDEQLYNMNCSSNGYEDRIKKTLKFGLPNKPILSKNCRIIFANNFPGKDFEGKELNSYGTNELYILKKCFLNENTQNKLIFYQEIEGYAASLRCLMCAIGGFQDMNFYLREMGEIKRLKNELNTNNAY